jgi:oxygen-dependent protoporphyrinogen oxidase
MAHYDVIIVGGGISGLSALHFLVSQYPGLRVRLLESDNRLGGTIGTDRIDGYSLDWGPNGFLDREPLTLQLCRELGLSGSLERANSNVTKRFILRSGQLREVPMSPLKFLTSDILSLPGRLRVLWEPFARGPRLDSDESIYNFVRRRIGREAADYLVQPMVSGIYGGLAHKLSLESCFPIMKSMEAEYGSLFKAMISKARQAKKAGKKAGGPTGPGGWLTSFSGGLDVIVKAFEHKYHDRIETEAAVSSITRDGDEYVIATESGELHLARRVILATPAYVAARLTGQLSTRLSSALNDIPYAPIAVVCLGYPRAAVSHSLDGFGFLVPQKEQRHILGSIWTSSIFRDRAPDGHVQFRCMVGGDGDHASMNFSDEQLVALVIGDMKDIVGVSGTPSLVKCYRRQQGIPQFTIGHRNTMTVIEAELKKAGGISVTGNAYYGIGLNDCVKLSHRVATAIGEQITPVA